MLNMQKYFSGLNMDIVYKNLHILLNIHFLQVIEIPMITDSLEEEGSPEAESGRSMSFSRASEAGESESRRVTPVFFDALT